MLTNNKEWITKTNHYKEIDWLKSSWQLLNTFVPFFLLWYLSYKLLSYNYPLVLLLCFINAGLVARIFIIMHDCSHSTFYKSKKLRNSVGFICGVLTLTPFIHWQKIHLTHHACSSNLDKRDIGDFPLMTVEEYLKADKKSQITYKVMRSPFFLFLIVPFVLFFILQRFPAKNIGNFTKKDLNSVYTTNFSILFLIALMSYLIGFKNFFMVQFPISLFISTIGVWMFFVQHQFEHTYWSKKVDLNYYQVAMQGSSFFKLNPVLNWFTANVGYHHIHHLVPSIPNYNLSKCHRENPEFQKAPTLSLKDSFTASRFKLWDENQKKLITFKELQKYKLD